MPGTRLRASIDRMEDGWFERLKAEIEGDQRTLRQLSNDAGVGVNYVQQMLKDGKKPGADRLARLLSALGGETSLYILTGVRASQEDLELLRVVNGMSAQAKRKARELFQALASGEVETTQ